MKGWGLPKILFFLVRRAFTRVIGLFGYSLVAERAGLDGIDDAIWNEGHFWPFVMIGMSISVLVDLIIEATKPDFQIEDKACASEEND